MATLGKPLVFYLKYMAEMNRLYGDLQEGEAADLSGLENDDAQRLREMVGLVGAAAFEQAAEFLELCGKEIEAHFAGMKIASPKMRRSRAFVKRYWEWGARIYVTSMPEDWFACGVYLTAPPEVSISLAEDVSGIVVPWLWSRGARRATDAIWDLLGGWPHSHGREGLSQESGTIDLSAIPVKAQPPESFDVDRDALIAEVVKVFARIGAKQVRAIAKLVASLREADEN
jgi:hypothetical protein